MIEGSASPQRKGRKGQKDYSSDSVNLPVAGSKKSSRKDRSSRIGATAVHLTAFFLVFIVAFLIANVFLKTWAAILVAAVLGFLARLSVHVAMQWEQAVVLRFGKLHHIAGPGLFFIIPIVEFVTLRVDQRIRCTFFSGERILTSDLVPVDVNAVFYWSVWDARKVCTEVEDYVQSVVNTAQACMRDVIGSMEIEELATRRVQIDKEICEQIAQITEEWGISVSTVKIRDITIPEELQDALSKAAQAQRERDARVTLAEVEKDISSMLVEAANEYDKNEHALQLRAIHAASEGAKDGGMIVMPSSLGDGFARQEDFMKRL